MPDDFHGKVSYHQAVTDDDLLEGTMDRVPPLLGKARGGFLDMGKLLASALRVQVPHDPVAHDRLGGNPYTTLALRCSAGWPSDSRMVLAQ